MPIECENCGKEYDPVSTRWKCNHCGMKTSCCEGEACAPVVQSGCQECCGGEACGELVADGFVVLKGSRARIEIAPSAIASVKPHRDKLIAAGILTEQNGEYIFTQDFEFPTPSAAAAVVLGRTANGWIEWVDESKRSLDDVYRKSPEIP